MAKVTIADTLSERGAAELCRRINDYWAAEGIAAAAAPVKANAGERGSFYVVRSRIGLYLPPRQRATQETV